MTEALAGLTPPVLTLETLLERDLEALQRDTGLAWSLIASFRAEAATLRLGRRAFASADEREDVFWASTGVGEIDALLGGLGFWSGTVSEVEGPTCSGKTQLLLTVAANAVAAGRRALVLDPGGCAFHAKRFRDLCKPRARSAGVGVDALLARAQVASCGDAWELLAALDDARETCRPGDVVVVEAPAKVLVPNLGGEKNPTGHQLLGDVIRGLNGLAADANAVVLVANSTSRASPDATDADPPGGAAFGEAWKGALGKTWTYAASTRLSLSSPGPDGHRYCALAKHPARAPDPTRRVAFRVADAGLEAVPEPGEPGPVP